MLWLDEKLGCGIAGRTSVLATRLHPASHRAYARGSSSRGTRKRRTLKAPPPRTFGSVLIWLGALVALCVIVVLLMMRVGGGGGMRSRHKPIEPTSFVGHRGCGVQYIKISDSAVDICRNKAPREKALFSVPSPRNLLKVFRLALPNDLLSGWT